MTAALHLGHGKGPNRVEMTPPSATAYLDACDRRVSHLREWCCVCRHQPERAVVTEQVVADGGEMAPLVSAFSVPRLHW